MKLLLTFQHIFICKIIIDISIEIIFDILTCIYLQQQKKDCGIYYLLFISFLCIFYFFEIALSYSSKHLLLWEFSAQFSKN